MFFVFFFFCCCFSLPYFSVCLNTEWWICFRVYLNIWYPVFYGQWFLLSFLYSHTFKLNRKEVVINVEAKGWDIVLSSNWTVKKNLFFFFLDSTKFLALMPLYCVVAEFVFLVLLLYLVITEWYSNGRLNKTYNLLNSNIKQTHWSRFQKQSNQYKTITTTTTKRCIIGRTVKLKLFFFFK